MFNFLKKWLPAKDEVTKPKHATKQAIAMLRREYHGTPLDIGGADPDPIKQFSAWFDETLTKIKEDPNAMIVSTAGADGRPSSRTVLLKGFDENGFVFFTNYEGRKARQIAQNPNVSITFYWGEQMRQVHVEGVAIKVSEQESNDYFELRPLSGKLSAWVSKQSQVVESRETIEKNWKQTEEKFAGAKKIPRPPYWGGYRVSPSRIEFWQGRLNRLHDRICYTKTDIGWKRERLSP